MITIKKAFKKIQLQHIIMSVVVFGLVSCGKPSVKAGDKVNLLSDYEQVKVLCFNPKDAIKAQKMIEGISSEASAKKLVRLLSERELSINCLYYPKYVVYKELTGQTIKGMKNSFNFKVLELIDDTDIFVLTANHSNHAYYAFYVSNKKVIYANKKYQERNGDFRED